MFNKEFNQFATNKSLDLYPQDLQKEIDEAVEWIYPGVQNGVYRCGFASTQEAYNKAAEELFKALDRVEEILEGKQYLVGGKFSFIDLRIFMTLIRFDPVYVNLFKCNKRTIESYRNISRYVKHLFHDVGLSQSCDMDHIKRHYWKSLTNLNPKGFVPVGPDAWWEAKNQ